MVGPEDNAKQERINRLREAFANIDPEEARRLTETLPEVDLENLKPGTTIAIHFPTKRPQPTSDQ